MHALVADVRAYPQFLPWCDKVEVLESHEGGLTARLSLAFAGVHQTFTTRNRHEADRLLTMELVDGPFSQLDGRWDFVPIGAEAGPASPAQAQEKACRIGFDLRYAFSSRALELVVSPVFDRIANTLVDAFVKRAEQVYGAR